jgi:hypothetical protein
MKRRYGLDWEVLHSAWLKNDARFGRRTGGGTVVHHQAKAEDYWSLRA